MASAVTENLRWLLTFLAGELTVKSACIYGLIFILSWLFSKIFIFPSLSPLNKIPGRPVTWRNLLLGHLPEILQRDAIDPYIDWVKEMRQGIIRYRHILGSQRLLLVDPEAVKDVLVTHAAHYPRPIFLFGFFRRVVGSTSLLTLEGHEHAVQRRLCNSAFNVTSVQALLPTFQKHVEQLCQNWTSAIQSTKEGPTKVDVQTSLCNLTFDIISEAGFGYSSQSLVNPDDKASTAFNFILQPSGSRFERLFRIVFPNFYNRLPIEFNKKFNANLDFLQTIIFKIIGEKRGKMADKSGKPSSMDLLEKLLSATDVETGAGLSQIQLRDHTMTFMLAGHETTASALTWILLMMAKHPNVQTKAREEVMSHLPRLGQPITYEDVDHMTYINCVVKEGLRLYPPAPVVLRQASKDMKLCDKYDIPKGTVVNISIGALHRNPEYWGEDADEFRPERFLEGAETIPQYAYQPFISGPHMCIGYRFALQEAKLALAMLLRQFEFSPLPGVTYRKRQLVTMRPEPQLWLNVRCVV